MGWHVTWGASNGTAHRNCYVQTQGWKVEKEAGSAIWTVCCHRPNWTTLVRPKTPPIQLWYGTQGVFWRYGKG